MDGRRRNGYIQPIEAGEFGELERETQIQYVYEDLLDGETARQWFKKHGAEPTEKEKKSEAYKKMLSKIEKNDPGFLISLAESQIDKQALKDESEHDYLTGLANRKTAESIFNTIREKRPYDGATVIVHLDLDGFKDINEKLGHAGGDEKLLAVTEKLREAFKQLRPSDIIARVGGDEFLFILTNVKPAVELVTDKRGKVHEKSMSLEETAQKIVQRTLRLIEEIPVDKTINPTGHLTGSAGLDVIVKIDRDTKDLAHYKARADKAGNRAKQLKFVPKLVAGSDRIVSAGNMAALLKKHNIDEASLERSSTLNELSRPTGRITSIIDRKKARTEQERKQKKIDKRRIEELREEMARIAGRYSKAS